MRLQCRIELLALDSPYFSRTSAPRGTRELLVRCAALYGYATLWRGIARGSAE